MRYAISYTRFSTKQQATGDSQRRQEQGFRDFCAAHDLTPWTQGFIDKGKSASKGHHREGDFGKFLSLVQAGAFPRGSVLVVEALDRFSREAPLLAAGTLQQICKQGVDVGIVSKERIYCHGDLADIGNVVCLIVDMCANHDYSRKLSQRMKDSRAARRERADGMTKNGRKLRSCPTWIQPSQDGKKFIFNDRATTLKEACLLAIAGHGVVEIRKRLNLTGKSWGGLPRILRSRTLIGELQQTISEGKKNVPVNSVEGFYPALITMEQWDALQRGIDGRLRKKARRGFKVTNLFTNLLHDANGGSFTVANRIGQLVRLRVRPAYRTPGRQYHEPQYQFVEDCLLFMLTKFLTPSMLQPMTDQTDAIGEIRANIADRMRKQDTLIERFTSEDGQDYLEKMIDALEGQLRALKTELADLEATQRTNCDIVLTEAKDLIDRLSESEDLLDTRQRIKTAIASLVERITLTVHGGTKCEFEVRLMGGAVLVGNGLKWKTKTVAVWHEHKTA